jgi:CP family cyanate transporter-like MFS transporter
MPMTDPPRARRLRIVVLLWLAGIGLRLTILAIPPVIPQIHHDLGLTATQVGLLGSLPVALFALAALPGSLLIVRLGATATVVAGLAVTAVGSALRGASAGLGLLYGATILMGAGVAVMQPAMPIVVREWLPTRIGFGTAVYSNGLLLGEIIPVVLTLPLVLPLVGGAWRLDLVVWSAPVAATAVLLALCAPRAARFAPQGPPPPWWPDWRGPLTWRLGVLLGCITSMYFGANTFLPDYLIAHGRADLIGPALGWLNVGQLPGSLLLLAFAARLEGRAWPFVGLGLLAAVSVAGLLWSPMGWVAGWAALLGFACGTAMITSLTLPVLLAPAHEITRTAGAMFALGYAAAPITAVLSGAAWDLTDIPALAFAPMLVWALGHVACALWLRARNLLG